MIPYFGPYIGTIPSALLILMDSPTKCLIFILFIIALQQVDSYLIEPRLCGSRTGLKSFWVLASILLFGNAFGIVGMLVAKFLAQRLRLINGQTVVRSVPWVKADDIVVAFHIFPPLVLLIAEICPHTGNGKILPAAVQRGQPVVLAGDKPAGFIKDRLHGKLVMLKQQVLFGGSVVGVFRVDMLECCQLRHLLS